MKKVLLASLITILLLTSGCVPLENCRVKLYGEVVNAATGMGLPDVSVQATAKSYNCESGPDGSYEMPIISMKPGRIVLAFSKPGYGSVTKEVPVSRSGSIRVDASLIGESAGDAIISFKFTLSNDYEPGPAPASAASGKSIPIKASEPSEANAVVVYPKTGSRFSETVESLGRLKAELIETDTQMGYLLVSVPDGVDSYEYARLLGAQPWAEDAEPDYICFPTGGYVPDDPLWPLQWGPRSISMHRAWMYGIPAAPVIVAVADTGVDTTHPDLEARCLPMLNAINTDMTDNDGHGTHVAGIIGATANNGIGMAGVVGAITLLPVKVMDNNGFITTGTMSSVSRGVRLATDNGADVINLSLGWPLVFADFTFRLLKEAIDYADSHGVAVIAASGNNSSDTNLTMPAKYSKCFAVSAVDPYLQVAEYSNIGPGADVFGPGGGGGANGVLSTVPFAKYPSGYIKMSGTSMATPHLSGVFAALMSSGMTKEEAKDAISSSSEYIEGEDVGLVNAYAALAGARGSKALFWLCDDAGKPLSYAFRGSDGSRDMTVFGDYSGHAWLCGWIPVFGADVPAQGDFFGIEEVFATTDEVSGLPSIFRLKYFDLEDAEQVQVKSVPAEWNWR